MKTGYRLWAVWVLLAFAGQAQAQNSVSLNPKKVKELLFTQGLGAKILQLGFSAGKEALPQTKARYDTQITLDADHTIDARDRVSTFFGDRTDTTRWNLGAEKKFSSGTTLGFDFLNEREKIFNANPLTRPGSPATYEAAVGFDITQSLGENSGGALDRAEIKQAERVVEALDFQTRNDLNRLLADTLALYWRWAISRQALYVGQEALNAAEDFLRITKEKEALGLGEKSDRLGAAALVSKRRALLATLQMEFQERDASLKSALNIPAETVLKKSEAVIVIPKLGEETSIRLALENRFDLQAKKKSFEGKEFKLVAAKQKGLPVIDLKSTLLLNEIDPDYGTAVGDADNPQWGIGVQVRFPLENRMARSLKREATAEKRKLLFEIGQLEQAIIHETGRKYRAVGLSRQALDARREASVLEKEKLSHAVREYLKARFSADLILRFQDDYLDSRREVLRAELDFALAVLAWKEAMNRSLE